MIEQNLTLSRNTDWLILATLDESVEPVIQAYCTVSEKPFELGRQNQFAINGTTSINGNQVIVEFNSLQTSLPSGVYFYDIKVVRASSIKTIQRGSINVI